jgi:hypothetical protein
MIWHLLSAWDRRDMRRRGGASLNTLRLHGTYRCRHRSHRARLRCCRYWLMDGYCGKHNLTCYLGCDEGPES